MVSLGKNRYLFWQKLPGKTGKDGKSVKSVVYRCAQYILVIILKQYARTVLQYAHTVLQYDKTVQSPNSWLVRWVVSCELIL